MKSKLKKTWKVRLKEDLQVRQGLAIYLCNYLNKWLRARRCVFLPLVGIKELEKEKLSLQSDSESYSDQVTQLIALSYCRSTSTRCRVDIASIVCLGAKITTEAPHYDGNVPRE